MAHDDPFMELGCCLSQRLVKSIIQTPLILNLNADFLFVLFLAILSIYQPELLLDAVILGIKHSEKRVLTILLFKIIETWLVNGHFNTLASVRSE